MLIFVKGEYEQRIVRGDKVSTVRPWRTCKLVPGDVLAFNGRTHALITHVDQRRLDSLTDTDAQRDGFPSRRAFRAAFRQHYPHTTGASLVWVLRFTLRL